MTPPLPLSDERELRGQLRRFAQEDRGRTHRECWLTLALLVVSAGVAISSRAPWPLRVAASLLEGLVIVRGFILFHDVMHGAIFRRSKPARIVFTILGALVLTPASVWRETHNYHHAHTAQIVGSHIGSYPLVTLTMWGRMSRAQRLAYRFARHPLTILGAYATVFVGGMCVVPFLRAPRRHWSGGLIVLAHLVAWVVAVKTHNFVPFALGYFAPLSLACAIGAYLFYAQHNFVGMEITSREKWSPVRAALRSSSHFEMGPVLRFFAGNIGLHHVHHLHAGIPFYRLPEAADATPWLQETPRTSFRPRDVVACLRLKVWDTAQGAMVGYPSD